MSDHVFLSPSQLTSFDSCERRWYLESQAGAARDGDAGGQYLVFGRLLDEAVERLVANPAAVLLTSELVEHVKAHRRRGELAEVPDTKWLELADRAVRQTRRLAGARLLPPTGTPSQFRYRVRVPWAPVTIVGRADYRAAGRIWDLKSTSDRGPGRGSGRDQQGRERPPNAKDERTLREDRQARLYAAAEFFADPNRMSVEATWIYASSQSTAVWSVRVVFMRAETLAWFDEHVRPRFPRLLELAASEGLAPEEARANHDACARCFVRGSCDPFRGAQAGGEKIVDIERLRARRGAVNRPAPAPDALEQQLAASLVAPSAPESRESVYESLVAEAAAVAGGTQDDRRADSYPLLTDNPLATLAKQAAVAGGTQDDRRADVAVSVNRPDAPPNPNRLVFRPSGTPGLNVPVRADVLDVEGVEAHSPEVQAAAWGMAEAPTASPPPGVAEAPSPAESTSEAAPDAAPASASDGAPGAAPAPKRGRGRRVRKNLAVEDTIEAELDRAGLVLMDQSEPAVTVPAPRAPTAQEAERVAALLAAARTLHDAAVAATDAYSAVRNQLRAMGVDPDKEVES